ncbi:hypothetical protein TNCT_478581 [Trichonephila clavata]|uniref:Uncharacterized protein n=1 Tax=Trichonephila clavata TaxID=2740835 RepID=A0A8X6FDL9_TRICU|nr:hypothetical protein TNCT_478581 [Trichonephila clavata]
MIVPWKDENTLCWPDALATLLHCAPAFVRPTHSCGRCCDDDETPKKLHFDHELFFPEERIFCISLRIG